MKSRNLLFVMPLAAGLALIVGCGEKSEKSDNSNDYDGSKAVAQLFLSGEKHRGRITQARADMMSLRTAFEGMYKDYGVMAKRIGGDKYALGGHTFPVADGSITIVEPGATDIYCDVIAELADPSNSHLSVSLNKRKIKYLDVRPEYDPSKAPTSSENKENTWLDPWGNPYQIRINVDESEKIADPSSPGKYLAAQVILWSLGPDGRGGTPETDRDNVASWKDGDWFD